MIPLPCLFPFSPNSCGSLDVGHFIGLIAFLDSQVRVTVSDSELAIARGDVEGALKKLRKIPSASPHYTKARMAMADIFLRYRKDKASYIKCYLDLVDLAADYDTYCMLGEAFMQVRNAENTNFIQKL